MKRTGISMAVMIGSALALAGCGNNGGTAAPTTPVKGNINSQNGAQVASALLSTIGGGTSGSSAASSSMRAKKRRSNFDGGTDCWTASGDQSDADGDGIPADATYTYASCSFAGDGWTETYNGTDELTDTSPSSADVNYADAFDLQIAASDSTGDSESDHYSGTDTSVACGSTIAYIDASSDDYTGVYQGQSYSGNETDDLEYTFSPNDPSWNPLTQPAPAGTEIINGSWNDTFGGEEIDTNVTTPTVLSYDPACNGGDFTAGQIVAASSDGSSVTITWNGCGDVTETVQGASGS